MRDDSVVAYYHRYHDPEARDFDLAHTRAPKVYETLARVIEPGGRCLDVGCGDGHAMAGFAGRHSLRYVGVDISPVAVQQARARGLEAYVQRPNELPFEKASFDSVTLLEVIEHLFDVEATLGEIHRVLKPGGVLAVSTPNVAYWRRRLDLALLGRWNPFGSSIAVSEPWRDPHIRFFNPGSIRRLLVKMGFEDVCVRGTGGGLLLDVPWLGHLLRHRDRHASPPYSALEDLAPAPFGCFLMGTCRKSR